MRSVELGVWNWEWDYEWWAKHACESALEANKGICAKDYPPLSKSPGGPR